MRYSNVRKYTDKLLELLEDGCLDWEWVCRECLAYMSEDDVTDMAERAGYFDAAGIEDDED